MGDAGYSCSVLLCSRVTVQLRFVKEHLQTSHTSKKKTNNIKIQIQTKLTHPVKCIILGDKGSLSSTPKGIKIMNAELLVSYRDW